MCKGSWRRRRLRGCFVEHSETIPPSRHTPCHLPLHKGGERIPPLCGWGQICKCRKCRWDLSSVAGSGFHPQSGQPALPVVMTFLMFAVSLFFLWRLRGRRTGRCRRLMPLRLWWGLQRLLPVPRRSYGKRRGRERGTDRSLYSFRLRDNLPLYFFAFLCIFVS